jgi:hypothetical protein
MLWLAEPGRAVAQRFVMFARERGWEGGPPSYDDGPWPDPKDEGVQVALYQLRRS